MPNKSYAPPTIIDGEGNGQSDILVKLALDNAAQERWFAGLNRVKCLSADDRILAENVAHTKEVIENEHGRLGKIVIHLPQKNMRTPGVYNLNFDLELKHPIYRLDIKLPSGRTKVLTDTPNEWYEIGKLLHIQGKNLETGELIIDEPGWSEIKVYARGYQEIPAKKIELLESGIKKLAASKEGRAEGGGGEACCELGG